MIIAAVLLAHGWALPHPFLIDDPHILADPRVQSLDWRAILTQEYWPDGGNRVWRPLTTISLALQWQITHRPWAFRAANLALHVAAAIAVWRLALSILRASPRREEAGALTAALIFAVHPLHTTVLNQIVDRADILAGACALWTVVLCRRDGERADRSVVGPILAVALTAAALLSKESAMALPGMALLADFARRRGEPTARSARSRLARMHLPIVLTTAAVIAARSMVLGGVARPAEEINPIDNVIAAAAHSPADGRSALAAAIPIQPQGAADRAWWRWGTPIAVFAKAVSLIVWPATLVWDYSYAAILPVRGATDGRFLAGAAILAGAALLGSISWRRSRQTLTCIGLAAAAYLVVSNVPVLIGAAFAERYLYLPLAGGALLAGRLLTLDVPNAVARTIAVLSIAAILALAARSAARHVDFADQASLNSADVGANGSLRLVTSAAIDQLNHGKPESARSLARRAVAIAQGDAATWRVLGLSAHRLRSFDEALDALTRAVALGDKAESTAVTLADIHKARGDYRQAIHALESHLGMRPQSTTACNNLAWYLLTATPETLRDPQRAVALAAQAYAREPAAFDVIDTYAVALEATGQIDVARRVLTDGLSRVQADAEKAELQRRLDSLR